MELNVRNEYQDLPIETLKKIQKNINNNVSILLFNIRTDGNIGLIIRQACLMGCKKIIICGRKHYDKRFTVGAHNYIEIEHWDTPLKVDINTVSPGVYKTKVEYDYMDFLKKIENYTPIFLEQGGINIQEISWKLIENPLVIVGNESSGVPSHFIKNIKSIKKSTKIVSIPQCSVMRSMNVAMATSIILWEITKN